MNKKYYLLLLSCMAGFIFGALLLFRVSDTKPSYFGEIKIENASELVDCALERSEKFYKTEADLAYNKKTRQQREKPDDRSYQKIAAYDSLKKRSAERQAILYGNADTAFTLLLANYYINRKDVADRLAHRPWATDEALYVKATPVTQYNNLREIKYPDEKLLLRFKQSLHFMDFVGKYPVFGFWAFVTLAQSTIWGLLLVLLIGSYNDFTGKLTDLGLNKFKIKLFDVISAAVILGIFCGIVYEIIIDNWLIDDHFFMRQYNTRMLWYALLGYALTICSLALNFVFMRTIDEAFTKTRGDANYTDEARKQIFTELNAMFNTTFYHCATTLSIFIFWTALLITSVNNLDITHLYQLLAGKTYIPSDYVFLIGLAHSLIILIFFVPVHLQLKKFEITGSTEPTENTTGFSLNKLWTGLSSSLGTILITASPLLTSFIQMILDVLIGK